jgi:hypothetical protein
MKILKIEEEVEMKCRENKNENKRKLKDFMRE